MKKLRNYFVIFTILLTGSQLASSSASAFSGPGIGTPSSPYQVRTCTQLQEIPLARSSSYLLMNDIDCTGVTWVPIGFYSSDPFTGTFDGDGYTISNISYTGNGPAGLFGYITSATITNVTVTDSLFNSIGHVGGIAGDATSSSLTHVHVHNTTVKADNRLGGIVGIMDASAISDSSVVDGAITGRDLGSSAAFIGGAVGRSNASSLTRVSISGTVTGNETTPTDADQVGGFVGSSQFDAIRDSYTTANVTGGSKTGGFIGSGASTSVQRSWSAGSVQGTTDVGGFYGYEGLSTADNSFAMGAVTGTTNVGGFIGHAVAIGSALPTALWDVDRSGMSDCVGLDESLSFATTCTGINAGGAAPNYFFNTSTNIPLNAWDFINVWRTTSSTPKLITSPLGPDNVRVSRSSSSLSVTWEVPADTGGANVTSYDLKYRKLDGTTFTYATGLTPTTTNSYAINGLDADTWYAVEIRAVNARGKGTWLGFVTTTNPAINTTTNLSSSATTSPTTQLKSTPLSHASNTSDSAFIDELISGEMKEQPIYSKGSPVTNTNAPAKQLNESDPTNKTLGMALVTIVLVVGAASLAYIKKH